MANDEHESSESHPPCEKHGEKLGHQWKFVSDLRGKNYQTSNISRQKKKEMFGGQGAGMGKG